MSTEIEGMKKKDSVSSLYRSFDFTQLLSELSILLLEILIPCRGILTPRFETH
jgi:hypothetical protein